ncbi:MAG TPA: outer membrane protein assembly factor BamA [Thermoanaerobaculia bacterium]|nr:outer membrane protein assembly factor BamA [Thermoanaerobaculia bacterium]
MSRILVISLFAGALFATSLAMAQPTPAGQPDAQKPKPGTILERPNSGKIIGAPEPGVRVPTGTALSGQKIERFEATGNASVASDTIRVYLGVAPGETYSPELLQKNFLNLWQTGLFDDIRIEAEQGETGVIVRVTVKERPRIGAVEYRGNKDLSTSKINEALEKEKIDLHVGNTIEQTLVRRAAEAIKKAYVEDGFEGVGVETSTENMLEPGEKRIVFVIVEGVKAKVAEIDFTGNKRFTARRLRMVMKEVKGHNLYTWIRKKDLYIPSKLDEDLEHLKNFYQDYGYMDVSFGDPQVVTVGKNTKKPRVMIVIPVKEGAIHTFGEVSVTGNTVYTSEQIIGNWPLKKGETIRRKPIQTRLDAFGDAYRARGYIYAYVNPEYVNKPGNVTDVKIQIYEGDQFRLGRLEFSGNNTTKDKVLRREIFLEEGDIMDMETFKQSIYKLGQLGYFKVTENPDFKVNPETKTVDVSVKGNEEGKNDVQFGGGYTEGGGFFVQSQFSTRNFLGEGESLGLSFQKGTRTNLLSLSYADPWFLDTPNSLGISVFNRDTRYPASVGFEDRGKGGSISYGYRLHRFDSLSLVYGLEHTKQHFEFNTAPDDNGNVPIPDVSDFAFVVSSIGPAYRFDSRDSPYDPMRGGRFALGLTYSGGPLGGTIHAFKPTVGATKFFHLSKNSSISFNGEAGYIFPLDKNCANTYAEQASFNNKLCVPQAERFLVGGEYSVRGFRLGDLGPHETINGQSIAVGGYKYHVVNTEYIYKINDPLRVVLFGDGGFSYAKAEKWDFKKTRFATGAELRIFLPVFQFPLRFIYAINPAPKTGDNFQSFQFTIGNTY